MFRFFLLCALIGLSVVYVEASWDAQTRVLALRLRTGEEIRGLALERARKLGSDWVRTWAEEQRQSLARESVSAPPPGGTEPPEANGDSSRLNSMVEEKQRP
jgi:hypothetical protein